MSTFKKPPRYAEFILRTLDASVKEAVPGFAPKDVLAATDWWFEGGTFGDLDKVDAGNNQVVNDTSETVLPHGLASDYARSMTNERALPPEIASVLARRKLNRMYRVDGRTARASLALFAQLTERKGRVVTGMKAVYAMASEILIGVDDGSITSSSRSRAARDLMEGLTIPSAQTAHLSLPMVEANTKRVSEFMATMKVPEMTAAVNMLRHLEHMVGRAKPRRIAAEAGRKIRLARLYGSGRDSEFEERSALAAARRTMDRMSFGAIRVIVWQQAAVWHFGGKNYVLPTSDLRKVVQLMTGVRNSVAACCCEAFGGPVSHVNAAVRGAYALVRNVGDAIKAGLDVDLGREIDVAKAYKDLTAIYKAAVAGPLAAAGLADLRADLRASDQYSKMENGLNATYERTCMLPLAHALGTIKVFRLLPPPDVCQATALLKRWRKACVVHTTDQDVRDRFKKSLRDVAVWSLMQTPEFDPVLKPGVARPDWMDDYRDRNFNAISPADAAAAFAWEGQGVMPKRDPINPSCWKDSSIPPDSFAEAEEGCYSPVKTSMLIRLLLDSGCPMPDVNHIVAEHLSNTLLKPESHKERIAYSQVLAGRQNQSRTEEAIGEIMAYHPAYMIMKTGEQRDQRFDLMASEPDVPGLVHMYFSFDISGWSENMPADLQIASHEVWDEIFGGDEVRATSANHVNSRVYCDSDGFFAWYMNPGANFEGYNGKEMTALHIAIMTTAVDRLRAAFPDLPDERLRIMLLSYIDDGVSRLSLLPVDAARVFPAFEQIVVNTWAEHGFTVEIKKSFPSDRFFEFLNEAFYAGRHLAHGVKAAMRITADPFEEEDSLLTRVAKLSSGARGTASAGMRSVGSVMLQSYFIANELVDWVRIDRGNIDVVAVAFWAYAPVTYGGLGTAGFYQQGMNAMGCTTEEGMAILRGWARNNADVCRAYVSLVRRGLSAQNATDVLSSPMGGRAPVGGMVSNIVAKPVQAALKKWAAQGRLSDVALDLMALGADEPNDAFARRHIPVGHRSVMQEQILNELSRSIPMRTSRAFIGRFEKKRTLNYLVGRYELQTVARSERRNAAESIAAMTAMRN